jgi:hypothetical protein
MLARLYLTLRAPAGETTTTTITATKTMVEVVGSAKVKDRVVVGLAIAQKGKRQLIKGPDKTGARGKSRMKPGRAACSILHQEDMKRLNEELVPDYEK